MPKAILTNNGVTQTFSIPMFIMVTTIMQEPDRSIIQATVENKTMSLNEWSQKENITILMGMLSEEELAAVEIIVYSKPKD